jgi:PAS domain-containing protein
MGDEDEPVAVRAKNDRVVCLAQPPRSLADGVKHGLNLGRRACDDAEDRASRHLLLQRLSKVLLRLGKLAGPLVELLLEIDRRGSVTTCSRRLLAVLGLRRPEVPSFHCYAARPLMKPSHEGSDRQQAERYHIRADVERGLDRGQRTRPAWFLQPKTHWRGGLRWYGSYFTTCQPLARPAYFREGSFSTETPDAASQSMSAVLQLRRNFVHRNEWRSVPIGDLSRCSNLHRQNGTTRSPHRRPRAGRAARSGRAPWRS